MTDDAQWRRPEKPPEEATAPRTGVPVPPEPGYQGPPPTDPPPTGWRPPLVVQPPPPRPLPRQDHQSLDAEERSARTLTLGVGMVAAAVLVVLLCAFCARTLF
ncbi:MAG TPA: translation initiation factor 2 [Micromonosporaceae bacterium]|nr:translation initiation factor 2 [Micromonosporaceae bacterium]